MVANYRNKLTDVWYNGLSVPHIDGHYIFYKIVQVQLIFEHYHLRRHCSLFLVLTIRATACQEMPSNGTSWSLEVLVTR